MTKMQHFHVENVLQCDWIGGVRLQCLDAIYSVNGKEADHPRGMALATRMQELQASRRGNQWQHRVEISAPKNAHRARMKERKAEVAFSVETEFTVAMLRGSGYLREECHWSHAWQRCKRSKGVKRCGILECEFLGKNAHAPTRTRWC
jgi:hypothetical protein